MTRPAGSSVGSGLVFVAVFVAAAGVSAIVAVLIGEHGLGVLSLGFPSPLLETVATLTLAMILYLEAVRVGNTGVRPRAGSREETTWLTTCG